jgi:hypothetical protein
MVKVPENPCRKTQADIYKEKYLGKSKEEEEEIKNAVNGNNGDLSLDYYIGAERMINNAIQVFMTLDQEELHGAGKAFSMMLSYVSYEIERLSIIKSKD